jgi:hypothetical protein
MVTFAICELRSEPLRGIELLATYVQASLLVRETTGNINQRDRAARLQASLPVRLRLTPSSRLAPATIPAVCPNRAANLSPGRGRRTE